MSDLAIRRKRFRLALVLAGLTQGEAATELGVGPQHLSLVLNGRRESKRLLEQVDAFAAGVLTKQGRTIRRDWLRDSENSRGPATTESAA